MHSLAFSIPNNSESSRIIFSPAFRTSPEAFIVRLPEGKGSETHNVFGSRQWVGVLTICDLLRAIGLGEEVLRTGRVENPDNALTIGEREVRPVVLGGFGAGELLLLDGSELVRVCRPGDDLPFVTAEICPLLLRFRGWGLCESSSLSELSLSLVCELLVRCYKLRISYMQIEICCTIYIIP